ncbi:MAG: glycosyltransferase family 39 protein, partial [Chloroflexales bacterium]|nr:glycosyltransferase family 39 protein [Chloroflexales bacterium]
MASRPLRHFHTSNIGIAGVLFCGGLLLRVWTLGWGLPYIEHPDEPFYVEIIVRMVRSGDPNPFSFWHPSLLFYILAVVTWLHGWWGVHTGLYASLNDIPIKTYLFTTAPDLYIWNRAAVACIAAVTVPLLYLLGRQMFDRRVALLSAVLLAIATFHIENSYFIATSATAGLFTTLILVGAWGVASSGNWRSYLLVGVGAGLAAGAKYNAGVIGLAVVVSHLCYWQRKSWGSPLWRVLMSGGVALLVFSLTNPFAILDWGRFIADLKTQSAAYTAGSGDFAGPWNIGGYAHFLWDEGLLAAGCLVTLLGLPRLLYRFPRQIALLSTAIALELLLLLAYETNFVRNLLLIFPLLILLTAASAVALADLIRQQAPRHVALAGLTLLLLVPQANDTAWLLNYWSKPYTLVDAAEQLRLLPSGMLAAVEMNPVQWSGDPAVTPVRWVASHPLDWYRARGFRYLFVNSDYYGAESRAQYERLLQSTPIIAQYPERDLGLQPGPGGAILDLGEQSDLIPFVQREVYFVDRIALLGYEAQPGELRTHITPLEGAAVHELGIGQGLQINLYWRALATMERDYTLFIHVIDQQGERVAQRDLPLRYEDYPTSQWQAGELVIDRADLPLRALPPGEYRLECGLYDATSGEALPAQGEQEESEP